MSEKRTARLSVMEKAIVRELRTAPFLTHDELRDRLYPKSPPHATNPKRIINVLIMRVRKKRGKDYIKHVTGFSINEEERKR
jgi:hypothetical protein